MNSQRTSSTLLLVLASLAGVSGVAVQAFAQQPAAPPSAPSVSPASAPAVAAQAAQPTPAKQAAAAAPQAASAPQLHVGARDAAAPRMSWAEVIEASPDPKVVTDVSLRAMIVESGLPWRVRDRTSGIEMLLVPAGKFVMGMSVGDTAANSDERPAHEVILTKSFYLGRTEVTQEQWTRMIGSNESYFQDINFEVLPEEDRTAKIAELLEAGYTRQQAAEKLGAVIMEPIVTSTWPVETLTWEEMQPFLAKTSMRLPTEAEWEYACRAGSTQPRYGDLNEISWNATNSESRTHPVGSKSPNALGFYDMIGNVWEWTNDWYSADYYRSCENGATDPTGSAQNPFRVLRGGSWDHDGRNCRASFRLNHFTGDPRITDYGFRIARTP